MNEKRGTRILDCPWLDQREQWPTGCESVSAALCLQYAGLDVTPDYFIDNCLPRADALRRPPHAPQSSLQAEAASRAPSPWPAFWRAPSRSTSVISSSRIGRWTGTVRSTSMFR